MKVFDLTHEIKNGMQIFPGDPDVFIKPGLTHESDYCKVDRLELNSHTGTHIDAPRHFLEKGKVLTDYPIDKFTGRGILIDVSFKRENEEIALSDVEPYRERLKACDVAIFRTGWSQYFGTERYFSHPYVSKGAAEVLVETGIDIVGVDFLNVDPTQWESWEAHPVFLSNDVLIVENLACLDALDASLEYTFHFFPLKTVNADGSPIRAVAVEQD